MKRLLLAAIVAVVFIGKPAMAAINVVACEPEWASLATELGGSAVSVYSATIGMQDPHQIQARPSLIAKVRNADMLVCTGAELEVGWLPILLRQSGNPKVQPNQPGYFEAASFVTMLEKPEKLDRAEGDIHAAGNPHIQTNPHNVTEIAEALHKRLKIVDPANAAAYDGNYKKFSQKWAESLKKWDAMATKLKGVPVVVHHKFWVYLFDWTGIKEVAELEPLPGIPPTAGHLATVLDKLKTTPAKAIIYESYEDPHAANWLSEKAGIPAVKLPGTVGGSDKAKDIFSFYDDLIELLTGALK